MNNNTFNCILEEILVQARNDAIGLSFCFQITAEVESNRKLRLHVTRCGIVEHEWLLDDGPLSCPLFSISAI
jgi:hypothetical protein